MRVQGYVGIAVLLALFGASTSVAGVIYDNGPLNRSVNAWDISGHWVSDSFSLSDAATISGFEIGLWTSGAGTPSSIHWAIGATPNAGDEASGSAALTNTYIGQSLAYSGAYAVYLSDFTIPELPLDAGTYYLTLSGTTSTSASAVHWDINNGPSVTRTDWCNPCADIEGPGSNSHTFQVLGQTEPAPEPATFALIGIGLMAVGLQRRKI